MLFSTGKDKVPPWQLNLTILAITGVIYPSTRTMNYQNFKNYAYVLVGAVVLAFMCVVT